MVEQGRARAQQLLQMQGCLHLSLLLGRSSQLQLLECQQQQQQHQPQQQQQQQL
jgi:hypothetical protein